MGPLGAQEISWEGTLGSPRDPWEGSLGSPRDPMGGVPWEGSHGRGPLGAQIRNRERPLEIENAH